MNVLETWRAFNSCLKTRRGPGPASNRSGAGALIRQSQRNTHSARSSDRGTSALKRKVCKIVLFWSRVYAPLPLWFKLKISQLFKNYFFRKIFIYIYLFTFCWWLCCFRMNIMYFNDLLICQLDFFFFFFSFFLLGTMESEVREIFMGPSHLGKGFKISLLTECINTHTHT